MATRFESFRNLATRLITKNGRLVTFTSTSTTPMVTAEPWGPNTPDILILNVPCVFIDYTNSERQNTLIQIGDKRCFIAKLDLLTVDPKTQDHLIDDGTNWEIVRVNFIQPGALTDGIMFDLQVRT